VLIDPLDPASPQQLERVVREFGVCGLRLQRRIPRPWEFEDKASTPLWAKAEELGITLDVNATHEEYPQVERRIRQFPQLRMVLDHCGYVSADLGPRTPTIAPVVALARYPNVYAKLTFFGIANDQPYPFPALHWMARQLIEAFGAERCLYGSNFPTAQYNQKMSYQQTVQLFSEALDLSADERGWILGGTAARLWRWGHHGA
jgi:predicted TIM-barrel fold metal-dependent hydrolase